MAAGHDARGAAPAGGHTEAEGGHKAPFPPFQADTFASQLVSLVIAFALLYIIVSRLALPRMKGVLMARQGAIDSDIGEAQKLRDQSDAALKAYEIGARERSRQGPGHRYGNPRQAECAG